MDIDHDRSTHCKNCVRSKEKMPQRDLQFPQSPVNLNISTKQSISQGQRRRLYLHKSWGVITGKTQMPMSVTRSQCVSISHKGLFFLPTFFFWISVFHDSSVLSSCSVECCLVNSDLQAFVRGCFQLFPHLSMFALHLNPSEWTFITPAGLQPPRWKSGWLLKSLHIQNKNISDMVFVFVFSGGLPMKFT